MSNSLSMRQSLEAIQDAIVTALEEKDFERLLTLVTEREPLLEELVKQLDHDESLRNWAEDYWHRDQALQGTAQSSLRRVEGQLSAYRIKRKVSNSYMDNARYTAKFIRENPDSLDHFESKDV